jgi:hypothetical protein
MSEKGILRIVVEGEDAQRFHDGLTGFIAESKENPDYRIEDPSGELYWTVGECEGQLKEAEAACIDCYTCDGRYKGSAVILWDSYEREEGLLKLTAEWLNTVEFINLGLLWVDSSESYFFEFHSSNWGICTNDAEGKHFEKIVEVVEYDYDEVPDDWAKDWDKLSFEQRVALCEKYNVIYMATRLLTEDDQSE